MPKIRTFKNTRQNQLHGTGKMQIGARTDSQRRIENLSINA